jgi:hypothetical protein
MPFAEVLSFRNALFITAFFTTLVPRTLLAGEAARPDEPKVSITPRARLVRNETARNSAIRL